MQRALFLPRRIIIPKALPPPHLLQNRAYATKRTPASYTETDLSAARKWLADLNPETIPRNLCEITFSRSSGPGGQNVNKVSSKATLRLHLPSLLPLLPPILHAPLLSSRYHAPKTSSLIIQADDARKQAENASACMKKLHELLREIGAKHVPNETGEGQAERVRELKRREEAGRRKLKERLSAKKSARRGGRGGED